jgi:hypothetical protein
MVARQFGKALIRARDHIRGPQQRLVQLTSSSSRLCSQMIEQQARLRMQLHA